MKLAGLPANFAGSSAEYNTLEPLTTNQMPDVDVSDPSTAYPINRLHALNSSRQKLPLVDAIETAPDPAGKDRVARISFNENLGDLELISFGEWMKALPHLHTVVLRGPKITVAGFVHLRGLNQITRLVLIDTLVTEEGKSDLLRALPNLQCEM